MNVIVLEGFDNYYNRIINRQEDIDEYKSFSTSFREFASVNFNPADGVETALVVNMMDKDEEGEISFVGWTPDYLLVIDGTEIKSRWFVLDANRIRGGQFQLSLRRDVIADNWEEIKESNAYIEKGVISDPTDPAVYNTEGFEVNQIKKSETLLKDSTKVPWLCLYIAKEQLGKSDFKGEAKIEGASGSAVQLSTTIENWDYYKYSKNEMKMISECGWATDANTNNQVLTLNTNRYTISISSSYQSGRPWSYQPLGKPDGATIEETLENLRLTYVGYGMEELSSETKQWLNSYQGGNFELYDETYNDLMSYNGKTVKDTEGRYFRINVYQTKLELLKTFNVGTDGSLLGTLNYLWNTATGQTQTANGNSFHIVVSGIWYYRVSIQELFNIGATWDGTSTTEMTTKDSALYDVICAPYGDVEMTLGTTTVSMTREKSLALMTAITRQKTSSVCYDLQLLPYCPVQSSLVNGKVSISDNGAVVLLKDGTKTVGFSPVVPYSDFTFDINEEFELPRELEEGIVEVKRRRRYEGSAIEDPSTPEGDSAIRFYSSQEDWDSITDITEFYVDGIKCVVDGWATKGTGSSSSMTVYVSAEKTWEFEPVQVDIIYTIPIQGKVYKSDYVTDLKASNECDLWRICSPNFNGSFDFSVAKNGGSVPGFNVDVTLKPQNPYIHVNPKFSALYGADFNDVRGLVCQGDFSLGIINDAWQQYEIQNKNYQNIFSRQIQNMDTNRKISVATTLAGAATGALSAGAEGMVFGNETGAGMGVASSLGSTAIGLVSSHFAYKEARSFAIDNFNMGLQNVQALPLSITKTSALSGNNKLFPFVEYYTCTDTEREAFKSKMEYDGMRIGRIDEIGNWMGDADGGTRKFVRAELLRNEAFTDDFHLLNAINDELKKGVYL